MRRGIRIKRGYTLVGRKLCCDDIGSRGVGSNNCPPRCPRAGGCPNAAGYDDNDDDGNHTQHNHSNTYTHSNSDTIA